MRFQLLVAAFFSLFVVSLCSLEDAAYIKGVIEVFNLKADAKDLKTISRLFLPNATYDPGDGPIKGVEAIVARLAKTLNPDTVTQFSSATQIIEQKPPFDGLGGASKATAVTYITITFFGRGKFAGLIRVLIAKYVDELVKTGDFAFIGGWKFASRELVLFAPPFGNSSIEID